MKIGIDCRLWNETGIGRYIRNIVSNLAELDQTNEYVLFVLSKDKNQIKLPHNFRLVVADIRWHSFKEQLILPLYFYRESLDVLFIPNLNVPVLYWKRFIVTIHDLTVTKIRTGRASTLPYFFYRIKRLGVRIALWYAVKRAQTIFTVSEFVKNEILNAYKVSATKVKLTPNAAEKRFKPLPDLNGVILGKYGIRQPYLFYVGNAHPHKNIERLIHSFEIVSESFPELYLVLGGGKKFFYERLEKEFSTSKVADKIKFIGYVEDEDLPVLYTMAEVFVNPSLYEGFGIQLLEAFACGVKVACSNSSSLPEVGGNIAYYFNPRDIKNMAEVITFSLRDESAERVTAGYARVKDFSWYESSKTVFESLTLL